MGRDELPAGVVTLLLADVEGSALLWETRPEQMNSALAQLDRTVTAEATACGGVRPVEQGQGGSVVIAFARASDAVGCALALARAPLDPIRLRIGIHTGEVQLREPRSYMGPTLIRAARLRDLAHGGQVVLSAATTDVVADALPAGCWLTDLGSHRLRDLARPERVAQLCHAQLGIHFPPVRADDAGVAHNLPARVTSFVGRRTEMAQLCAAVPDNRLVTLTGAGGVGKTRLAIEVAAELAGAFVDGLFYVDLAPIANGALVPVRVARALGLSDKPGSTTMQLLVRFVGSQTMLLLIDNCEHLLDACATLINELLQACPQVTAVCTSREPLGVPGEVIWRVPSLSLADEAVELFADRARLARPESSFTDNGDAKLVARICERLDGMPLAIELAAARVRALSLPQIAEGLRDRFRLLTGGARTAAPRHQTLRASVEWSHGLLAGPQRVLFRRLAVFTGGFDLDAAQAICATSQSERRELRDHLSLLVDKSLVVADHTGSGSVRYRLLETVRQYAQETLDESCEGGETRARHCDYYSAIAAALESRVQAGAQRAIQETLEWGQVEIDNLRAAFAWCREIGDDQAALELVSALQPFWGASGRFREGCAGFEAVLTDQCPAEMAPEVWVRAVADHSSLTIWLGVPASAERARAALALARELGDPALIARALIGCGIVAMYDPEVAQPYAAEALDVARARGLRWSLCLISPIRASASCFAGDPMTTRTAAEEGRDVADAVGDLFFSRMCRMWLTMALWMQGDLAQATEVAQSVAEEAEVAGDLPLTVVVQGCRCLNFAYQGEVVAARAAAGYMLATSEATGIYPDAAYAESAVADLAAGDAAAAKQAAQTSWRHTFPLREVFIRSLSPMAEAELACGDLAAARRWADDTVAVVPGWYLMQALTVRAMVAAAQGEPTQAERDARRALGIAADTKGYLRVPDALECLARLAAASGDHTQAARLLGAADTIRQGSGQIRFPMYEVDYQAALAAVRDALSQRGFDTAWAEGAAMSTQQAIAFATRGRGRRSRASSGWESLTPTERDVVRLVTEGLTNKDIATRLFVSPRTVQTHLTHIYAKLNLTTRTQLTKEALRHT